MFGSLHSCECWLFLVVVVSYWNNHLFLQSVSQLHVVRGPSITPLMFTRVRRLSGGMADRSRDGASRWKLRRQTDAELHRSTASRRLSSLSLVDTPSSCESDGRTQAGWWRGKRYTHVDRDIILRRIEWLRCTCYATDWHRVCKLA